MLYCCSYLFIPLHPGMQTYSNYNLERAGVGIEPTTDEISASCLYQLSYRSTFTRHSLMFCKNVKGSGCCMCLFGYKTVTIPRISKQRFEQKRAACAFVGIVTRNTRRLLTAYGSRTRLVLLTKSRCSPLELMLFAVLLQASL